MTKPLDGNDQGNEQLPNSNQPQQQAPQVGREVGNVDEGDKEDEVEEETDKTAPVFAFDHNYDLEQYHRGVVGISVSAQDDESGVDGDSLKYLWSTSPERPSDEDTNWQSFDNGSSIYHYLMYQEHITYMFMLPIQMEMLDMIE